MENLRKVLKESFSMLFDRPQLFVPRLFSASISSLAVIGWVAGVISEIEFLMFFPVIAILGAFTPVMVSSMVRNDENGNILKKGFNDSLSLWKPIIGLMGFTVFLAFVNSIPLSLGLMAASITGNMVYLVLGSSISILFLLIISFGLYFVPISIIENKSFFESLNEGFSASNRNRTEVVVLIVFSLAVLGASSLVTGYLRDIGLAVFFLGRMASSIVGTYLLVVSPKYYLEEKYD